jgi:hypothetical protein
LALVFLHLLSGLQMEQPLVLADELGYLGNARYLAGASHLPVMRDSQFYHFGYSLILMPAFWLLTDPVSIYRAAMVINALLMSALFFPVYSILSSFLEVPKRTAIWISFACSLYPSLMLYSNFAWAENAFIPFYALTVALVGRYLRSKSWRDAILFGCCAGFLYTIHPRALPVVVIIVVYLLLLATLKILSKRQALLSVTTIGLVFAATRVVTEHLKAIAWSGTGEFSVAELGGRLLPGSQLPLLLKRALGQLLYLSQATYGLFLVGLVAAVWYVLEKMLSGSPRRVMADPKAGVRILLLITAPGIFVASLTVRLWGTFGPDGIRGAGFIPGRYNEAFAVLFLAFALAQYCQSRFGTWQIAWRALAVPATILGLAALVMSQVHVFLGLLNSAAPPDTALEAIPAAQVDALDVPGVFPVIDFVGELNLYLVSLAAIALYFAITTTMRYSQRGGLVLLMLTFASFSLYNQRHYLRAVKENAEPRLTFVSQSSRLGPIRTLSFDSSHYDPGMFYGSQYLLQHTRFSEFDSSVGDEPESEIVISGTDWGQARLLGAELVLQEGNGDFALWVLPGEVQSSLPPASYDGVTLGVEPRFRVRETGFHAQEWLHGAPVRWTNGAASLRVPLDLRHIPLTLEIDTVAYNRDEVCLQILANGIELWHQWIPPQGWSKAFSLEHVPLSDELVIELNSDTFTPAESPEGPADQRSLGVMVRGIRLITPTGSGEQNAVDTKSG